MTEADIYAQYSPDSEPKSADSLTLLRAMAQLQLDRERTCERIEGQLKEAQAALYDVQCQKLPTLMSEAKVSKIEFDDSLTGEKYVIAYDIDNPTYAVSMPGKAHTDKRNRIYEWLRSIGEGGIIKKTVAFPMGKLTDKEVDEFIKKVQSVSPQAEAGVIDEVAPATLKKIVTKLRKAGKNVHEDLSIYEIREAKVSKK